jgi:hypothetical protein
LENNGSSYLIVNNFAMNIKLTSSFILIATIGTIAIITMTDNQALAINNIQD